MVQTIKLQEKLVQAGYKYLRLCDTEIGVPEISHYTLEKSKDADPSFCVDNVYVDIESEEAQKILDWFLNPIVIYPNPIDI